MLELASFTSRLHPTTQNRDRQGADEIMRAFVAARPYITSALKNSFSVSQL